MRPLDFPGYVTPAHRGSPGFRRRSGNALLRPHRAASGGRRPPSGICGNGEDHSPGDGDSRRNTGDDQLPTAMAGHGVTRASEVAEVGGFDGTKVHNQHYAPTSRLQDRSAARWQEPHDLDPQVVGDNGPCVIPLFTTATRTAQDASIPKAGDHARREATLKPLLTGKSVEFDTVVTPGDRGARTIIFEACVKSGAADRITVEGQASPFICPVKVLGSQSSSQRRTEPDETPDPVPDQREEPKYIAAIICGMGPATTAPAPSSLISTSETIAKLALGAKSTRRAMQKFQSNCVQSNPGKSPGWRPFSSWKTSRHQ